MPGHPSRAREASPRVPTRRGRLRTLLAALVPGLLVLAAAVPARGQEADTAGAEAAAEGPERIGAFYHVRQEGARLLVTPDTSSSLDQGARLFLRCRGGNRGVFVALTGDDGGLGNEKEGAAGQFRIDRGPWTDLEQWGANASGTAAFMNPERIPTFVGRARKGALAEIRIVNPVGVRKKFVFRIDGLGEGLSRLPCLGG